jgi:tetratricopeptide (TPR) repeat protein
MKSKPAASTVFSCLLCIALVAGICDVPRAQQKATSKSRTVNKPSEAIKKDADYWFNKGALVSTYGNNKAAVVYFQKAIAMNPNFSRAYFSQGVSFGQLGVYQQAIAQINRALKMEPENGLYYYGRGRVYLMSGDKVKAMEDFEKAAQLGDEDALDYLKYIGEGEE